MKILIIGDIFGEIGKTIIMQNLPIIRKQLEADIVIANAENIASGGKGITYKDYKDIVDFGVDYITLGNHAFNNDDIHSFIDEVDNIIRPENFFDSSLPGVGHILFNWNGKRILLMNILGKELMNKKVTSPYEAIEKILDENNYDLAILDFHGETTSEKKAISYYFSSKIKIFYGTHTHVQTADEYIYDSGNAYISDVGMVGIYDSAIGVEFDQVISQQKNNIREPFVEKKKGIKMFNAVLISVYDNDLIPYSIERINIKYK